MDAASIAAVLWFALVRPPAFVPSDLTRIAEARERERARIRAAIALSHVVSPAEARLRALILSEHGGSGQSTRSYQKESSNASH
jgi:hypothetical protein